MASLLRGLIPIARQAGLPCWCRPSPGCIPEGEMLKEALSNAREAVALHVDSLIADGDPVPHETAPPELVATSWARGTSGSPRVA
jgi:predicted RNase H-like HicB family nuclease